MSELSYTQEIVEQIGQLTPEQQKLVLDYARSLSRPKGTPGYLAVQYAREIGFAKADLAEMAHAIEEWCELENCG
jgi:hypothetical protein